MEDRPREILCWEDKVMRNKVIPLVKVLWTHHGAKEATWEREDQMKEQYPGLFRKLRYGLISRAKFSKGGRM